MKTHPFITSGLVPGELVDILPVPIIPGTTSTGKTNRTRFPGGEVLTGAIFSDIIKLFKKNIIH